MGITSAQTERAPGVGASEKATAATPQGVSVHGVGQLAQLTPGSNSTDTGTGSATTLSFEGLLGPEEPGAYDDDYYAYGCECEYDSDPGCDCVGAYSQDYYLCASAANDVPSLTRDRARILQQVTHLLDQPTWTMKQPQQPLPFSNDPDILAGGLGRLSQLHLNGARCTPVPHEPGFAVWDAAAGRFQLAVAGDPFQLPEYGPRPNTLDSSLQPSCGGFAFQKGYAPLLVSSFRVLWVCCMPASMHAARSIHQCK